jgi:hypothetical protein
MPITRSASNGLMIGLYLILIGEAVGVLEYLRQSAVAVVRYFASFLTLPRVSQPRPIRYGYRRTALPIV